MAEKTTNDLDQKPLLHELMDHVITNSWYLLGVHLKLETKDLKAIDAEQQSINMKLCKMYELWLDTDLTATRRKLITALKRPSVSELAVADKYENMFQLTDDEEQKQQPDQKRHIAKVGGIAPHHHDQPREEVSPVQDVNLPANVISWLENYSVERGRLNMKFTDDLLILLTLQIENMEEIAPHFNMSPDDLQQIQREKRTSTGRVVSMLSKWRKRNRERATCLSLIKIFINSGHFEIIKSIISNIRKYIPSLSESVVPFNPVSYPTWNNLSDIDKEIIRNQFRDERDRVRDCFAEMLADIQKSFHDARVNHAEVTNYLVAKTENLDYLNDLKEVKDIIGVFTVLLSKGCSWLNYHHFDIFIKKYGKDDDKAKMTQYVQRELWPYLQQSLYTIPPESVECQSTPTEIYRFMLPIKESESYITGQQLKQMQSLLADKLDVPVGCVQIQFEIGSIIVHFLVDKQLLNVKDIKLSSFAKRDDSDEWTYNLNTSWIKNIPAQCWTPPKELCLCGEVYDTAYSILKRVSEKLSQIPLPVKIIQLLYTEGVIDKRILNELESKGGYLTDDPLSALLSAIYMDHNMLKTFGTILLRSKKTVPLANVILNEYDILCNSIQYHGHLLETLSEEDTNDTVVCVDTSSQLLLKQLKGLFVKSVSSVVPLIANGIPSLNELKLFLERAYVEMKPELAHAETMDDVLILVIEKCSLINVSCLEAVIDRYDIKSAKEQLMHYVTIVDEFCEKITINQCFNESIRLSSHLLHCDKIQFVPMNDYSLNQVISLKKSLFGQFADRVLIHSFEYKELITVICYAPQHLMNCLQIESDKRSTPEVQMDLMKATSHGMHAHMYNMEDDGDSHRDKVSVSSTSTKIEQSSVTELSDGRIKVLYTRSEERVEKLLKIANAEKVEVITKLNKKNEASDLYETSSDKTQKEMTRKKLSKQRTEDMEIHPCPTALAIAGSDSGGGAGIQADLKTFSALGVYGCTVITALTAQNTLRIDDISYVDSSFVKKQLDSVFSDLSIKAVKVGMLSKPEVISAVAQAVENYKPSYVVVDPIMVAKNGSVLLQTSAIEALKNELLPKASLITLNRHEAAVILNINLAVVPEIHEEKMIEPLLDLGPSAVLLKGGVKGRKVVDFYHNGKIIQRLEYDWINTIDTHGAGCTLTSAITAFLARGFTMDDAVYKAREYISKAIEHAEELRSICSGRGPVHQFFEQW